MSYIIWPDTYRVMIHRSLTKKHMSLNGQIVPCIEHLGSTSHHSLMPENLCIP